MCQPPLVSANDWPFQVSSNMGYPLVTCNVLAIKDIVRTWTPNSMNFLKSHANSIFIGFQEGASSILVFLSVVWLVDGVLGLPLCKGCLTNATKHCCCSNHLNSSINTFTINKTINCEQSSTLHFILLDSHPWLPAPTLYALSGLPPHPWHFSSHSLYHHPPMMPHHLPEVAPARC